MKLFKGLAVAIGIYVMLALVGGAGLLISGILGLK
jgi:hypothetical protein